MTTKETSLVKNELIIQSTKKLFDYINKEKYFGWDPYDGLNSRLFQITPFSQFKLSRMIWIQLLKRSPINLRRILFIEKEYNSKGIALILTGYCNLHNYQKHTGELVFGEQNELLGKINYLANLLISIKSVGYSGSCWGYSFDWQSKAFFLPRNTPTIVASSFAAEALLNAYKITNVNLYFKEAISTADFILSDLNIIEKSRGFMFSYSPLDNRAVYNATLLGTRILSYIYDYTKNIKYLDAAYQSALAVSMMQLTSGAFLHSDQVGNKWRDSFHTGFKLESLQVFQDISEDKSFESNINLGFNYWVKNFFLDDGTPKYYDNKLYPIDLHCTAQALVTIYKLKKHEEYSHLYDKIASWSIRNLQNNKKGYFYFQKTKNYVNKIEYMRWPQSWMLYGLSFYLLAKAKGYDKN